MSKRFVSQSLSCIFCALWAVSKSFVSQCLSCIPRALRAVSKSFVSQSLSLSSALWAQRLAHKTLARLTTPWQRGNTLCYSGRHIDRNSSNFYKVKDQDNLVWSVFKLIICKWFCKFMLTVAYMSPLCPCVNSILHDQPVLDTRMVVEAALDHSWKDKMLRTLEYFFTLFVAVH